MEKNFEKATREKVRFETSRGPISTEDLWDLPLLSREKFNLDTVARQASKALKETEEESFVKPVTKENTILKLRLKVVERIIEVRLQEKKDREEASKKRAKKDRILEIIGKKQDETLESKSIEELEKELEGL